MSFGCERSCSSPRRASTFNSKVPQGGIYPHIQFQRYRLNIFELECSRREGLLADAAAASTAMLKKT